MRRCYSWIEEKKPRHVLQQWIESFQSVALHRRYSSLPFRGDGKLCHDSLHVRSRPCSPGGESIRFLPTFASQVLLSVMTSFLVLGTKGEVFPRNIDDNRFILGLSSVLKFRNSERQSCYYRSPQIRYIPTTYRSISTY